MLQTDPRDRGPLVPVTPAVAAACTAVCARLRELDHPGTAAALERSLSAGVTPDASSELRGVVALLVLGARVARAGSWAEGFGLRATHVARAELAARVEDAAHWLAAAVDAHGSGCPGAGDQLAAVAARAG